MSDPLFAHGVDLGAVVIVAVKVLVAFGVLLVAVMLAIWFERKVISDMQNRVGPNRAGPYGILQTLADGIKLFFKEDFVDQGVADERPTGLRTLWSDDLVRRVVAVNRLKLCLLVVASGLGLLALAVLVLLANAVVLVITLAIVGTVLFLLARRGLAEGRRTNEGR
jgi:NADH:ubiquinone oxidoreductase subunit H